MTGRSYNISSLHLPATVNGNSPLQNSVETPSVVLVCDVGNSRVKFGLFRHPGQGSVRGGLPECLDSAVSRNGEAVEWDAIRRWLSDVQSARVVRGVLAGTNPSGVKRIREEWLTELNVMPHECPDRKQQLPLEVDVEHPERVGIDRLLNAVACNAIRPADRGAVVIDSGTATTVDVVDSRGVFRGGAILPGFELSGRALHEYTALLPHITIDDLAEQPHPALGRNTAAAIRSGLFWGQVGAIRELVTRLTENVMHAGDAAAQTVSHSPPPLLLLTGGAAALLAEHLDNARREPHLSLQGLVLAAAACEQSSRNSR